MDAAALLSDLIAIPSVNPMGKDVSGAEYFETRVSQYLVEYFCRLGVAHEHMEVAPGRANVIARYDSPDSPITVLLDAHQDTVPVTGMTIDPFKPVVKKGRMYGRGACDVKGGLAAMLCAFSRVVHERPRGAASVVMSCTCDEESTVLGVTDLVALWSDPARHGSLLSRPPDVALVAEPTELDVVVAHRGATRWRIRTTGRACHSSRPAEGINAIYLMARVLICLEEYAQELGRSIPPHPLCGPPTLSVGRIEGGSSVNTVPDQCTIEIDRRLIPGEDGLSVIADVDQYLRSRLDFEVEMLPPWIIGAPLADDSNGNWADRLLAHVAAVAGPRSKVGVPYGTHASRFDAAGVPSIVCGPGCIAQAHTRDEWIALDQLNKAAEIYYRFCCDPEGRTLIPDQPQSTMSGGE